MGFFGFDSKRPGAHYAREPQLLAQLVVHFGDGSEQRVVTDGGWTSATGRHRLCRPADGRAERPGQSAPGWDRPGYDAAGWLPASCHERGAARWWPTRARPSSSPRSSPAAERRRRRGGELIVDFGQNLAGWCRLRVDGPPARLVRVRHAEVLAADGSLYVDNLRTAARPTCSPLRAARSSSSLASRSTVFATPVSPAWSSDRGPRRRNCLRRPLRHAPDRLLRMLLHQRSTSSSRTSTGASEATSSASPPTARNATSGSGGSAMRRSSYGRRPTTAM